MIVTSNIAQLIATRLQAFKQLGIKEARTLVFAELEEDVYNLIAGICITQKCF